MKKIIIYRDNLIIYLVNVLLKILVFPGTVAEYIKAMFIVNKENRVHLTFSNLMIDILKRICSFKQILFLLVLLNTKNFLLVLRCQTFQLNSTLVIQYKTFSQKKVSLLCHKSIC